MNYSHEVENMCPLTKGPHHGRRIAPLGRYAALHDLLSHGADRDPAGQTVAVAAPRGQDSL